MKRWINTGMKAIGTAALIAVAVAPAAVSESLPGTDPFEEPVLAGDYTIKVEEKKKRFNPKLIRAKAGTVKFTVVVPKSAKHKHGVGVDGGVYNDIDGAAVKPGSETSLTIDVEPGRYVIYDSYKKNRRKGFRTKVIVE